MKLRYTIIIICLISFSAYSQYKPGAKQIALSNSDVALSDDVFSLFNNPAGLAQLDRREIGLFYSPAPFGLSQLSNTFICYNEPAAFGSFGIGGMTYGFDLYRESKIVLGFAHNFDNKFFAGTSINYQTVAIKNYGKDGVFFINLGGLAYITDKLRLGFSVYNINRAGFGDEDDQIPMVIKTGISFDALNELVINFAIEKDLHYNPSVQFGINYDIIEYLSLRSGFSNEPSRYTAGIGVNYTIFSLDYAFFTHNDLGLTHQAGLIISFE